MNMSNLWISKINIEASNNNTNTGNKNNQLESLTPKSTTVHMFVLDIKLLRYHK